MSVSQGNIIQVSLYTRFLDTLVSQGNLGLYCRTSVHLCVCPSVPTVGTLWAYIYGERYLVGLTYLVGLLSLTRTWVSLSRKQPYKLIGLHFSPKVTDSSRNFVCDLGKVHSSRAFLMNVLYVWTMHNIVIHMWTIHDNFLHKHL